MSTVSELRKAAGLLEYAADKIEELEKKNLEAGKYVPYRTCSTCTGIGCNNSMEWECNPGYEGRHWNPNQEYLKKIYPNIKLK